MNVSLPDELRSFVDQQVDSGHYGSTSGYIRRGQDRQQLRTILLDGASSETGPVADADYFAALRRNLNSTR